VTGAFAVICESGSVLFNDMPTYEVESGKKIRNELDIHAIYALLISLKEMHPDSHAGNVVAVIERQQAMPDHLKGQAQGSHSVFVTGKNYGILLALLVAANIPYEVVAPVSWKSKTMKDMGKEKDASRIKALQLFPQCAEDLKRKKDHNRADALLLAEYGLRYLNLGISHQPVQQVLPDKPF
jgi:crossover junction endodeoxyribonuclease RuvC